MTMPKFEPAAWLFKGFKPGYRTEFASIDPCESQTWPTDNGMVWNKGGLYTADQLAEAYEAGKRDAVPEGWVLVTKKPTLPMLRAMYPCESTTEAYKAMIAAAPKGLK